jgi:hypothetical protein
VRYVYLGTRETDPSLKGQACDPVRDERGRCIRGRGNQLVRFADGRQIAVVARRLRVRSSKSDWTHS